MLPDPTITRKLLTNDAFGFPRGEERAVDPIAVLCLHVTDNPKSPPASASDERDYANRNGSNGPSAHYYVDRDKRGSAVLAVDPLKYAAWSNGDVRSPRLAVPGIPEVVDFARRRNANEAYAVEIETCGSWPEYPQTQAQIETVAFLAARAAMAFDLPISRATMHLHSDLNTETRNACPAPREKAVQMIEQVIALASLYVEILDLRNANAAATAQLDLALRQNEDLVAKLAEREGAWTGYADRVSSAVGSALAIDRP